MTRFHKLIPGLALAWLALISTTALSAIPERPQREELDRIVAVVNDDVILRSELEQYLRKIVTQLRARQTRLPPLDVLQRQALERMVLRRLQLQLAERTGIRVDDETLSRAIRNIARQNHMSIPELRSALQQDGIDYDSFREDIRQEIVLARLKQRQIDNRVQVSDQEVEDFLERMKKQQRQDRLYNYSHILIALPEAPTPEQVQAARQKAEKVLAELRQGANFAHVAVSVSDGQKALEGGEQGWKSLDQLPTLFADVLARMQPGEVSDLIQSPSGFHILRLNEVKDKSQRHLVEQTLVRHILLRTSEVQSDAEAKLRLEQLRERIEGGEDFAALARAHSEDTLSAREGGNLGWVSPGDMIPAFEEQMNKLGKGELSQPFKTRFGWHLVQVLDRQTRDDTDKFLKAKAREILRERKAQEMTQQWLRRLRDEAYVEYRLDG